MWFVLIAVAAVLYVLGKGLNVSTDYAGDSDVSTVAVSVGKTLFGLPQNVSDLIDKYAAMYGVNPTLAKAQAYAESRGNQDAKSSVGAIGVFQLMPSTAAGLGVNPYDMEQNVKGGVKYLSQMLRMFGGNVSLALAAYNAGPGHVKEYGGIPPFQETQNYVKEILGMIGGNNG